MLKSLTEAHLADWLDEALVATDLEGRIEIWNAAAERLYGWSRAEAIGRPTRELLAAGSRLEVGAEVVDALRRGEAWAGDFLVSHKNGSNLLVHVRHLPIRDDAGDLVGILGLSTDVTTSRALDLAREEAQSIRRLALSSLPALIAVASIKGGQPELLFLNEEWESFTGITKEQLRVPGPKGLVHPDDLQITEAAVLRSKFLAGEPFEQEVRLRNAAGEYRWFLFRYRPVLDLAGQVGLGVLVGVDVDEQRRAQREREAALRELRRHERRYETLTRTVPALIALADTGLQPIYLNPRWMEYTGLSEEELRSEKRLGIYHPADVTEKAVEDFRKRVLAGEPIRREIRLRRHDGEYRWHEFLIQPVYDDDEQLAGFTTVAVDVHDGREAGARLEQQARWLQMASEAGHVGIWNHDFRNRTSSWSREIYAILGADENEHIDADFLMTRVPDEDRERVAAQVAEASSPGGDGRINLRHRIVRTDGETRWVHVRGEVLFEERGDNRVAVGAMGTLRDYTEERQLVEDLRRANAVKDEFLGLVSHELRTPLTAILGLSRQLALRQSQADTQAAEIVSDILHYGHRLHESVENMLTLGRLDHEAVELTPLLPQRLVARLLDGSSHWLRDREVELSVEDTVPPVEGHEGWLEQIIENLLTNADKYSPRGTAITVEVRADGREAILRVCDRGSGITEDEAASIFTPFYRATNSSGKPGAGLGLAVCRRLVELQGGTISARPREGGGSIFEVRLPLACIREAAE